MLTAKRFRVYALAVVAAVTAIALSVPADAATVRQSTIRFGQRAEQQMTVFTPTSGSRHPAVLFIHGGAWRRSSPMSSELTFGRNLAVTTGWVVAVTGYNAASVPGWKIQPANVAAALRALRNGAHVKANRVALWGESAGGNLALITGYRYPDLVRGVVSVSGGADMQYEYKRAPTWLKSDLRWFERGTPASHPSAYAATSPIRHVRSGLPPTLLATSTHDPTMAPAQQSALCDALHAAGDTCQLATVAGNDHSNRIEPEIVIRTSQTVRTAAIRFLSQRLDNR